MEVQTILGTVLLTFQLSLGLWQIGKLTPVGGLVKGGLGWLLSFLPFRRSSAYALLQRYEGRVFKRVKCAVLTKAAGSQDELVAIPSRITFDTSDIIQSSYLGNDFTLARRDGNKLFINDKMSYYITDAIWENLKFLQILSINDVVFVKGYKEFWEFIITGGLMTFSEVLDCFILENETMMWADNVWLLPVNLSLSEEKLLKFLNLVGLFLQSTRVFWLIPTLLSFASAVLEFNTTLRAWLYAHVNQVFCWSIHVICDKLSHSTRRQVYSLGAWVENLKPCNDIQLRIVHGDISAIIGEGAKAYREDATLVDWLNLEEFGTEKTFNCDGFVIWCNFEEIVNQCIVVVEHSIQFDERAGVSVACNNINEFMKICTFVSCVAKTASGSLKSCDRDNKVQVRRWKESVRHYVKSGLPPIYELKLNHVIVQRSLN